MREYAKVEHETAGDQELGSTVPRPQDGEELSPVRWYAEQVKPDAENAWEHTWWKDCTSTFQRQQDRPNLEAKLRHSTSQWKHKDWKDEDYSSRGPYNQFIKEGGWLTHPGAVVVRIDLRDLADIQVTNGTFKASMVIEVSFFDPPTGSDTLERTRTALAGPAEARPRPRPAESVDPAVASDRGIDWDRGIANRLGQTIGEHNDGFKSLSGMHVPNIRIRNASTGEKLLRDLATTERHARDESGWCDHAAVPTPGWCVSKTRLFEGFSESFELRQFPFDFQDCTIFMSLVKQDQNVRNDAFLLPIAGSVNVCSPLSEWDLLAPSVEVHNQSSNRPLLAFRLRIKRRWSRSGLGFEVEWSGRTTRPIHSHYL